MANDVGGAGAMAVHVGSTLNLATHPLTRGYSVAGAGVVTVVKLTDPVNHRYTVIVRTPGNGYLHVNAGQEALNEEAGGA